MESMTTQIAMFSKYFHLNLNSPLCHGDLFDQIFNLSLLGKIYVNLSGRLPRLVLSCSGQEEEKRGVCIVEEKEEKWNVVFFNNFF